MRFSTIFASAAAAGLTSAAPAPISNAMAARGPSAQVGISKFEMTVYPNNNQVMYSFDVQAVAADKDRAFPKAHCQVQLEDSTFQTVRAFCDGNDLENVVFTWTPLEADDDTSSGFELAIAHTYRPEDGGMFVDVARKDFYTKDFVTGGEGSGLYHSASASDEFTLLFDH
jgi:hypothetical protein